jgi:hypothetical protein
MEALALEFRRLLFNRRIKQRDVVRAMLALGFKLKPSDLSAIVNGRLKAWDKARTGIVAALVSIGVEIEAVARVRELRPNFDAPSRPRRVKPKAAAEVAR